MATTQKDDKGNSRIACAECDPPTWWHRLDAHLNAVHKMTAPAYQKKHPDSPIVSEYALKIHAKEAAVPPAEPSTSKNGPYFFGAAQLMGRVNLSERDRALVPLHDEQWEMGERTKVIWEGIALGLQLRKNVMLVGPTGAGKTAAVMELASVLDQPVRRINMNGDVRVADFVGEMRVDVDAESGEAVTRWVDGVLTTAMREGHLLLIDELDAAPPQILFVLQPVLERGIPKLLLTSNGGEVVVAHEHFRVVATANTLGKGDDSALYAGTNVLNEAFLNRFGISMTVNYPDQAMETKIVTSKSELDEKVVTTMVKLATEVRQAFAAGTCFSAFSTRQLIDWAELSRMLKTASGKPDVRRAAEMAFLNRMPKDDRSFVENLVQRHFGGTIS